MAKLILRFSTLILTFIVVAASLATAQTPHITSLSKISNQQFQTIVITGTGFGTHSPYTGNSNFISFGDSTRLWEAGYAPDGNSVGLIVNSWQDTQIVLGGFSGDWGGNGGQFVLAVGDRVGVSVFNAQSGTGPAHKSRTVAHIPTTTTLTSAPNPSLAGQDVTFTADVNASGGNPPDGEAVSFMAGTTVLGSGTLSGGMATFTTSTLGVGTTVVTAVYAGDANYKRSKSNSVKQIVN